MSFLEFGAEVVLVSASGALSPGPLFFANLLYGSKQGTSSGLKMAYGHTVVELPLIVILSVGLFSLASVAIYTDVIGLVGGISILGFAALQVASVVTKKAQLLGINPRGKRGPFFVGIVLSALNPFFLVWWFTVGLKLILDSAAFGLVPGIAMLFLLHIWMDFAWLAGTAYLASKGTVVLKSRYYPMLLIALAAVLVYYGVYFTLQSVYHNL